MTSLLWVSDPHLNFINDQEILRWAVNLSRVDEEAEGLLITGDISEAPFLHSTLQAIVEGFANPVYFITGNHDYFKGSWGGVDGALREFVKETKNLFWLEDSSALVGGVPLVGTSGWYDAIYGSTDSSIALADFRLIQDFSYLPKDLIIDTCKTRAKKLAMSMRDRLWKAAESSPEAILVASHVAPFPEVSFYHGEPSDRYYLPWYASAYLGSVLDEASDQFPDIKFKSFCGHSHGGVFSRHKPNLDCFSGQAQYYFPAPAGIIDLETLEVLMSTQVKV